MTEDFTDDLDQTKTEPTVAEIFYKDLETYGDAAYGMWQMGIYEPTGETTEHGIIKYYPLNKGEDFEELYELVAETFIRTLEDNVYLYDSLGVSVFPNTEDGRSLVNLFTNRHNYFIGVYL